MVKAGTSRNLNKSIQVHCRYFIFATKKKKTLQETVWLVFFTPYHKYRRFNQSFLVNSAIAYPAAAVIRASIWTDLRNLAYMLFVIAGAVSFGPLAGGRASWLRDVAHADLCLQFSSDNGQTEREIYGDNDKADDIREADEERSQYSNINMF